MLLDRSSDEIGDDFAHDSTESVSNKSKLLAYGARTSFRSLYEWQMECGEKILDHFGTGNFFSVEAATGTGKSLAAGLAADTIPGHGLRVLVVGMGAIVRQHAESMEKDGGYKANPKLHARLFGKSKSNIFCLESPSGKPLVICTLQLLGGQIAKVGDKRFSRFEDQIDCLIFDESHKGASADDHENAKYIPQIRDNLKPRKYLLFTATPKTINLEMFGPVTKTKANTHRLNTFDAMRAGILSEHVKFANVHTGTDSAYVSVDEFKRITGVSVDDAEEDPVGALRRIRAHQASLLAAASHSKNADDEVHAAECEKLKMAIFGNSNSGNKNLIVAARCEAMIDLYFKLHRGERAIFFCPSIQSAMDACGYYNRSRRGGNTIAEYINSNMTNDEVAAAIDRFKDDGGTAVIFAVGMLQEGFDLPSLKYIFDCNFHASWNDSRLSTLIQKFGRLVRRHDATKTAADPAIYYCARSVTDYYSSCYTKSPQQPVLAPDDVLAEGIEEDFKEGFEEDFEEDFKADGTTAITNSLLEDVARIEADILGHTKDAPGMVTDRRHEDPPVVTTVELDDPVAASQDDQEADPEAIIDAEKITVSKKRKVTVAAMYILVQASGDAKIMQMRDWRELCDNSYIERMDIRARMDVIIAMTEKPSRPTKAYHDLYSFLETRRSNDPFYIAFKKRVYEAHPDWFEDARIDIQRRMDEIIAMTEKPKQGSKAGQDLNSFLSPRNLKDPFYIAFKERVYAAHPDWFKK